MGTPAKCAAISPIWAFALLAVVASQISCTKQIAIFKKMEIDPNTLKLHLQDERVDLQPPASEYYLRFRIGNGRYMLDHYGPGGRVRYNAFFVDADDTIVTRTKYQVLLSGPFGTVCAESTYFYAPSYKAQGADFFTVLYLNGLACEPFQVVSALPTPEKRDLSGISVIRIFQAPPEFLVVSVNYGPDGRLESLHVNGAEHGEWVHSKVVHSLYPDLEVATMIGDRPKTREYFGLPIAFSLPEYRRNPTSVFHQVELKSVLDVVNFHYERNLWVQQDSFLPGAARQSRILTYVKTSEDRTLEPVDSARPFGQF